MSKASELQSQIGQEVGVSRWFALDQARIDAFAGLTEDEQFIHVDPERAKTTPFGGTIAHGFLTLSLASARSGSTWMNCSSSVRLAKASTRA